MSRKSARLAFDRLAESSDDSEHDGVAVVMTDSESSSNGRSRRYVVSTFDDDDSILSFCNPKRLSRKERICLLVGVCSLLVIIVVFILVGVLSSSSGCSSCSDQEPWKNIRLPANVSPMHYDVRLAVDLSTFEVTGSVDISCRVVSATKYVILHYKDMTLNTHTIMRSNVAVDHTDATYDENDFFYFELANELSTDEDFIISLEFNYTLRDDLSGFYKSDYTTSDGEKRYLATTQFEPTDARKAFPCFDEPAFKANFTISITHDAQHHAVSNMPPVTVSRSRRDAGTLTTSFHTSVRMSTYLVAFIVSDFQCVMDVIDDDGRETPLTIQVCSNPGVVDKTHYALQVAKNVITFYEQEFGVTYPLPKQDLFAIPDFSAGAMENWGLITYRETALLYDEETNPATSKQRVAVVIAHELAHQWFGNLVTMAWWDGLWLNEGFASFMEYIGTDNAEPDFNMLEQFVVQDLFPALRLDALNASHPILQEVANPDEINSLFDTISYSKGGSVIRMLRAHLQEQAFKTGITSYLGQHEYANAETHQLWEALQESAGSDPTVTDIMDTWTKQMGYPVLTVSQADSTLTQTRFFAVPPEDLSTVLPSPYNYVWKVPFSYMTESRPDQVHSMMLQEASVRVVWPAGEGWIKANVEHTGFYRVNYDRQNWARLIQHLNDNPDSSALSPLDRAGLLDDAFALSSAGVLDTRTALQLVRYLPQEREYVPWRAALDWLYTLSGRLSLTPAYGVYRAFVLELLQPVVDDLPLNSSNLTHLDTYLRSAVLQAAWQFGEEEVIASAQLLFSSWRDSNESVDPDLRAVVYQVGVAYGCQDDWEFVWQQYQASDDPYEKRLLLRALAQSTEPWILSRYLNYSISRIRAQDTLSVIVYVSYNVHGRFLAWNFIRNNWQYINEIFGGASFFDRLILYLTQDFSTQFELDEVSGFFERNPDAGSGTRAYRQAIELIKGNVRWLEANQPFLEACLSQVDDCLAAD